MKAEPHTHEVKIAREYDAIDQGHYVVTYGDTRVIVKRWWWPAGCFVTSNPSEKLVMRCVRKAIWLHDEGSRRAGEQKETLERLKANIGAIPAGERWASEVASKPERKRRRMSWG